MATCDKKKNDLATCDIRDVAEFENTYQVMSVYSYESLIVQTE